MDDPNTLKLIPPPDSSHYHRVLMYGIAALFIIATSIGVGYLLGTKTAPQSSTGQIPITQPAQAVPSPISPAISLQAPFTSIDSWEMTSATNVELLVSNLAGQRTGYLLKTNDYANDIPNAIYDTEGGITDPTGKHPPLPEIRNFSMEKPQNGVYQLQIIGKNNGKYHIDIIFNIGEGTNTKVESKSIDGTITINQVDNYSITLPEEKIEKIGY